MLSAAQLVDVLERTLHSNKSEWLFFRELRVGAGFRNNSAQRLDAFALNCLPHLSMKRVCYEVKTSRADFFSELKSPSKRRVGMRYSNEFYFVTPRALVQPVEIPPECGLIEIGTFSLEERIHLIHRNSVIFYFDEPLAVHCVQTVTACWRDTAGPTWQFAAAMLRNQRKQLEEQLSANPKQQKMNLLFEAGCDLVID
jgi:hypothetical protein